jgi:hypothetical protein
MPLCVVENVVCSNVHVPTSSTSLSSRLARLVSPSLFTIFDKHGHEPNETTSYSWNDCRAKISWLAGYFLGRYGTIHEANPAQRPFRKYLFPVGATCTVPVTRRIGPASPPNVPLVPLRVRDETESLPHFHVACLSPEEVTNTPLA